MIFTIELYVATGVGGCGWSITAMVVRIEMVFLKISNINPSSVSVAEAMKLCTILNLICNGPLA